MIDRLRANANLVESLGSATRHGGSALADAPILLRKVLEEDAWREFITQRGDRVEHATYASFVSTPPLKGLGVDMALIDRIVGRDDPDLLRLHKAAKSIGQGRRTDLSELPVDSTGSYGAERSDYTVERLARDSPEEYEAVRSGGKSINAAAVAAGIRPRRVSIRTDDAESIANTLRKNVNSDVIEELVRLLQGRHLRAVKEMEA